MFTSQDYLEQATDDMAAAKRHLAEGNYLQAKEWHLTATLNLLRFAVRRDDGLQALRSTGAHDCVLSAAAIDGAVHPTDLLDGAHVAILLGEERVARTWLQAAASTRGWSSFWVFYATCLANLITGAPLPDGPLSLDLDEQRAWIPYLDLMRGLSTGAQLDGLSAAVRAAFLDRQSKPADPGLLDGRPGDKISWDWRCDAILAAAGRPAPEGVVQ